jgi:hypothetical protein
VLHKAVAEKNFFSGKEVNRQMTSKLCALSIAVAFLFGSVMVVAAQAPAPAPAPAAKPAEKPADKPAAPKLKRATGTVKSASETSVVVETTEKDKTKKEWTFILDKATKLTKGGKSVTAKDIVAGDTATVSYDDKMTAKNVALKAPAAKAASQPSAAPAAPKPAGQK